MILRLHSRQKVRFSFHEAADRAGRRVIPDQSREVASTSFGREPPYRGCARCGLSVKEGRSANHPLKTPQGLAPLSPPSPTAAAHCSPRRAAERPSLKKSVPARTKSAAPLHGAE